MNRRNFMKMVPAIAALPVVMPPGKGTSVDPTNGIHGSDFPYCVYCYERGQGEWTFKYNTRGSFAPEREYMTFDEEEPNGYLGFMYDGVLHFQTFEDASDFVWMHSRAKDDTNLIDSIYDIYYVVNEPETQTEIQVAHYWFNGDTGSQIHWETPELHTNWNKVEFS